MPEFLFETFWVGPTIWALLFISDYTLTITCARLYQTGVRNKIVFEGSYELTPFFQRDIDSLRTISPRFIFVLVLTPVVVLVFRWLALASAPDLYPFLLGALILTQLSVHTRHFRNLFMFRAVLTDDVRGRIEYSRRLSLRASCVDMLSFCGLFLTIFAFTQSWFVLGGGVSCFSIAMKHWRLSRKHARVSVPDSEKAESATSAK